MLNQPASTTRLLGRFRLAAPLVLGLAFAGATAQAQVAPTPAPAEKPAPKHVTYYLDGQQTDLAAVTKINPDEIGHIQMLKSAQQQQIFGTSTADGAAVITTKANANSPTVLALNKRVGAVVPLVPATPEQNAAMAAAKAYIAKTYPNAQLQLVGPAQGQNGRYQAVFTEGGQRLQLLFDGNGQPVRQ